MYKRVCGKLPNGYFWDQFSCPKRIFYHFILWKAFDYMRDQRLKAHRITFVFIPVDNRIGLG